MIEEEIELKSNNVKEKTQIKQFCSKQLDTFYDILAILISIFDIITDVWIMIEWYYHGRIIFFAISLTILILANFAYLVVFFSRYGILNPIFICCCGCFMLPIAPFLSFFMYIVDTFNIHCDFCCFDIYAWSSDLGEGNESRKWMENKLSKHIGFLFEGIMEAFPQCILQMIAIVYFNESDIISIISIICTPFTFANLNQDVFKYNIEIQVIKSQNINDAKFSSNKGKTNKLNKMLCGIFVCKQTEIEISRNATANMSSITLYMMQLGKKGTNLQHIIKLYMENNKLLKSGFAVHFELNDEFIITFKSIDGKDNINIDENEMKKKIGEDNLKAVDSLLKTLMNEKGLNYNVMSDRHKCLTTNGTCSTQNNDDDME
eukprot:475831_1